MKPITEFLLSKDYPTIMKDPKEGCEMEDICNWLEYNGVTDRREFDFGCPSALPKKGELLYICGPYRNNDPAECWVSLRAGNWQQVTIKPKGQSFWLDEERIQTHISFKRAIELAKELINNPNKILTP